MGAEIPAGLIDRVAMLVRRMTPAQRARLLEMVPELRRDVLARAGEQTATTDYFERRMTEEIPGALKEAGALFLGQYTLDEFCRLPEDEQTRLWDQAHATAWKDLDDIEYPIRANTLPPR